MKTEDFPTFAAAATEARANGFWPTHRRDGRQVYANEAGELIAFVRDDQNGSLRFHITRDVPNDSTTVKENPMKPETNTSTTNSGAVPTPESLAAAVAADPVGRKTKAKTAAKTKPAAPNGSTPGAKPKGAQKTAPAAKTAAKAAPKAGKPGKPEKPTKTTSKAAAKPAKAASGKTGGTRTASKAKPAKTGEKTARSPAAGPRPGSIVEIVIKMTNDGKTNEAIGNAVAKAHPKTRFAKEVAAGDYHAVTWYRWSAKKRGWLK